VPKILRIINRLNLGGPTYNVAYLTKFLEPSYQTLLVAGQKDPTEESSEFILNELGITPRYIKHMKREIAPLDDLKGYLEIKNIIREFKPDIVHTHAAKAGTLGRLAASACKVPVIVHTFHGHVFHSYFSPLKTQLFINIERYLANKSTAIIAISEKQKNDLVNVFKIAPESKTHIVKLGFDLNKFNSNKTFKRDLFRKKYKIKNDEIIVTIVGRLVPIKNHIFLIKAIDLIKDKLPDKVKFFIVGDGELRNELLNECSKRAIPYSWFPETQEPQLVTFISWQKEIDVVNAGSDLILLCSHNEGTPVSLIEAQASGKPVISANVGGVADIVSHKTGLLYQPNNMEDFCEKLLKLLVDNNYRETLAANGWNEMKQTFSYNRLINEMDKLYKKLLNA